MWWFGLSLSSVSLKYFCCLWELFYVLTLEPRSTSPSATEPDVAHRRQSVMVRTSSVGDVLEQLMATKVNPSTNSIAPKKYTQGRIRVLVEILQIVIDSIYSLMDVQVILYTLFN